MRKVMELDFCVGTLEGAFGATVEPVLEAEVFPSSSVGSQPVDH